MFSATRLRSAVNIVIPDMAEQVTFRLVTV